VKNLYLPLLLLTTTTTFAQGPHFPWVINQIIHTTDSTGIAQLWSKDHEAIGAVRPDGTISNEVVVPGTIIGFGKFKGKVLALCTPEEQDFKVKKEVHALLIDDRAGKLIADNVIYTNTSGNLPIVTLVNDDEGNFQYLLVRTSGKESSVGIMHFGKDNSKILATTALAEITLAADLKPVVTTLPSAAVGADFIAAYANRKGELFIISHANDQVIAEQFRQDGHLQQKLNAPLDFSPILDRDDEGNLRGIFDPRNIETLTFAMTAKDHRDKHLILSFFIFDFASGKIPLQQSSVLDGDYSKQFKDNPDWKAVRNAKKVEEQRPDGIIYLNDKLLIFTDIRYTVQPSNPSAAARYESEATIVNIFDRQYHLIHQLFMDKDFESFLSGGRGLSYHLHNGKIYAFGTENDGAAKYRNALFIIDPDKDLVTKITPDYGDGSRQDPVALDDLFWTGNFFAKYQLSDKKYDGSRTNSFLVKYSYQ
jgi:hypothetical protein